MALGFKKRRGFINQEAGLDTALIYSNVVGQFAHFFDRPEERLRFINTAFLQQSKLTNRLEGSLGRLTYARRTGLYNHLSKFVLELWLYKVIYKELKHHLPIGSGNRGRPRHSNSAPFAAQLLFRCYQFRHSLLVLGALAAMALLFGFYSLTMWTSQRISSSMASHIQKGHTDVVASLVPSVYAQGSPQYLPEYRPEKVWVVERKDGYERYSNGGRVLTNYETTNHPRGYYVFQHGGAGVLDKLRHEPVGVVYHTSESDLMSFTPDNNESIEAHTHGLLDYVKRNRSYNYVIDRFGEIHRIVQDDNAANHAGNSIWGDQRGVYVGLNESFIGVCFETKTDAGADEQLTEAQLIAGRLLTQILRSRYRIDDANCVTHGLVSVNPDNMLICFHHDWVRNFPFESMGLTNKYGIKPVGISEYGFTYNDEIVRMVGGEIWPGARAAIDDFQGLAEQARVTPDALRRSMRNRYRDQLSLSLRSRISSTAAE